MTEPKPKAFQTATVKAALKAFGRQNARFLVADEVGLGKTVVAQQIMLRMMENKNSSLVVIYVCNNLSIAAQNRRKLLEILPEDERACAQCGVDRLTFVLLHKPPSHPNLNLYTLTPETSIPIRKGRRRDGRQEERALIQCLVEALWPKLLQGQRKHLFQRNAKTYWHQVVNTQRNLTKGNKHLVRTFNESVRKEFQLRKGQHALPVLLKVEDHLDLIAKMRNALAASAIEELSPDLIIFDEFQNFRDVWHSRAEDPSQRVIKRLRGEGSDIAASLLLLSATPFRMYTRNRDAELGVSHHEEFFDLVEFLYGGNASAKKKRMYAQDLFSALQTSILRSNVNVHKAKEIIGDIQCLLSPIMSRTERASHRDGWSEHSTSPLPSPLLADDVRVYRHFSQSIQHWQAGAAVPYWTSIPLPAQTMGIRYKAWQHATKGPVDKTVPKLTKRMRDSYLQMEQIPHPKLRSLLKLLGYETHLLPWLQPSVTWWSQKKPWTQAEDYSGKVLIFSRFRAVPQAIASLVSYAVESHLFSGNRYFYSNLNKRKLLQPSRSLLCYFHPSPWLVENTDPLACKECFPSRIRRKLRTQLISALSELGIAINHHMRRSRHIWKLLCQIEVTAGVWENSIINWRNVHDHAGSGEMEKGLGQLINEWDTHAEVELNELSGKELDALVDYAFHSPGVAVGRALKRHWPDAVNNDGFYYTLLVSWQGLRNYLDSPLFEAILRREQDSYPKSIFKAIRDGNLEAVLDEQLWLLRTLHNLKGKALAKELLVSFQLRSGVFNPHELSGNWNETFSLRCHVAMPMSEVRTVTVKGIQTTNRPLRTDEIRRAFNTPFWPNVLATTSVGQEGLDFHTWCSNIVHWDLSHNPVDLEQREGRIQRFAGHSTRREIARKVGRKLWAELPPGMSPWRHLAEIAEEQLSDNSGLCPWWVFQGADVKRYVFDVPTSEQKYRLALMKEHRVLYRLALGQPNQEDFLHFLSTANSRPDNPRDFTVELSAYFLNQIQ